MRMVKKIEHRRKNMLKQFNFRLPEELVENLRTIAENEAERTGYVITVSSLIRKELTDFCREHNLTKAAIRKGGTNAKNSG